MRGADALVPPASHGRRGAGEGVIIGEGKRTKDVLNTRALVFLKTVSRKSNVLPDGKSPTSASWSKAMKWFRPRVSRRIPPSFRQLSP